MTARPRPSDSSSDPYGYIRSDLFWVDHQQFLLFRGYKLRPRYEPGWIGSWKTNGKHPMQCDDSRSNMPGFVIDAIRTIDNLKVSIKIVSTWSEEIPVARYLSSKALRGDHRNHTVPILDVIALPDDDDSALLVMPYLREFDDPPFQYLAECIEAFRQMLEGLVFMHEHNIAHRDACSGNIMMDSSRLIPGGFHHAARHTSDGVTWLEQALTARSRLSVAPVDYYFIDFGLSIHFDSFEERHYVLGRYGQNRTVPEWSDPAPHDPFPVDVYQLGGVIKKLVETYHGLRVFGPLAQAMSRKEPRRRPTSYEALHQFEGIVSKLSPGASKARVALYSEWLPTKIWRNVRHCCHPEDYYSL